ncbi:MAG: GC-type dockerin domain-anchored protein [Phycisphaerales bacterium]
MAGKFLSLCAAAGGLFVCQAAAQLTPDPFQYTLDDGSGNFTIGPSEFDANMTWLNTFTIEIGRERITHVQVSFGDTSNPNGVPGPDRVTVAVLDDPNNDGDPRDAELLGTGTGVWTSSLPNRFFEFQLDRPVVIEGRFFVAVMMDVVQRANPARMDPQGQGGGTKSWLFYNPEDNLDDLGSSPFILRMSDSQFRGAWMIRALGASQARCIADVALPSGELNFFDVREYLRRYRLNASSADIADPRGVLNIFDFFAFVSAYNAGCP